MFARFFHELLTRNEDVLADCGMTTQEYLRKIACVESAFICQEA